MPLTANCMMPAKAFHPALLSTMNTRQSEPSATRNLYLNGCFHWLFILDWPSKLNGTTARILNLRRLRAHRRWSFISVRWIVEHACVQCVFNTKTCTAIRLVVHPKRRRKGYVTGYLHTVTGVDDRKLNRSARNR